MSVLDQVCKFKIGDFVTFKTPSDRDATTLVGFVVERWLQECYGGQQAQYSIRWSRRVVVTSYLASKPADDLTNVLHEPMADRDNHQLRMHVESELQPYETSRPISTAMAQIH